MSYLFQKFQDFEAIIWLKGNINFYLAQSNDAVYTLHPPNLLRVCLSPHSQQALSNGHKENYKNKLYSD